MTLARLRLEGKGGTASGYRIWLDDTELTNVTREFSLDMSVDDANLATLVVYVSEVEIGADVEPTLLRARGKERTSWASRFREWLR
jgi:hypothetical protein